MSEVVYNRRVTDRINAPVKEVPSNDHDMILQMWHAVIGTNGSGLIEQHKETRKDLLYLKKNSITKEEFPELLRQQKRQACKEGLSKAKRIILFVISILGGAATMLGILKLLGMLKV